MTCNNQLELGLRIRYKLRRSVRLENKNGSDSEVIDDKSRYGKDLFPELLKR